MILSAAHVARLQTICIAIEESSDGEPPPEPRVTGIAWVDALSRHPASLHCVATRDALDDAYRDEVLLRVRLRGRALHALAARPRIEPVVPPVFCPVVVGGTLDRGPPRPPLYLLVEDGMRTDELLAIDADQDLRTLTPVLLAGLLPNHPENPGPLPDAPPYPLPPDQGVLGLAMRLLHASPPVATGEVSEIFFDVDEAFDARFAAEVEGRIVAARDALAACYEAERRGGAERGGLVRLTLVTDAHAAPFDVGCTGSGRSSPALCECIDGALTAHRADPSGAQTADEVRHTQVALWLRARSPTPTERLIALVGEQPPREALREVLGQ